MCSDLGRTIDEFLEKPKLVREFHIAARSEINERRNDAGNEARRQLE